MNNQYKNSIEKLTENYAKEVSVDDYWNSIKYHMFCGLKSLLIPDLPIEDLSLFRKVNYYKDRAYIDIDYLLESLENTTIKDSNNVLDYLKEQAGIVCTFHLGSYRLLNSLMMNHGIDFTLVVDQATFDKQEEIFIKCHETICESTKVNTEFEIIVADEDSVGLKMIRLLKKQKNVLLYIDGNTGVGGAENTSKMESIKFLNKDIFSRKGIAALSYITDVPIFPAVSYYENDTINVEFLDKLTPNKDYKLDKSAGILTQEIYDQFSEFLLKYPEQWEGWLYYSMFVDKSKLPYDSKITMSQLKDDDRFKKFELNGEDLVFDYKAFNCFKLPKPKKNEEVL